MKCLVAEDSPIMRRILVNSLRAVGVVSVIEAANGLQALERWTPDVELIIADWNMPVMGGLEMVRELRAHEKTAGVPVLMVTARNLQDDVRQALSAGVTHYLLKPFSVETFRMKMAEMFPGRSSRQAAG